MTKHDELTRRRQRALDCAVFQADLHATPQEHLRLVRLKHAVRLGQVDIVDATRAVNQLRQAQQQRAA